MTGGGLPVSGYIYDLIDDVPRVADTQIDTCLFIVLLV